MDTTLAIDCGGGGIKGSVLDPSGTMVAKPIRVPTPYPLPPQLFVSTLVELAARLPKAGRVTVGIPGMIRHGVVVRTPHYVTRGGPRTRIDPALEELWFGFNARAEISQALGLPVLVLNDAEVHGAGVVAGTGVELVLTFGTGLGCALFDGGRLAPHLEFSQAPVRWGMSYDTYIGEPERRRLGNTFWSRRVRRVVEALEPVFVWDRIYLGGGNSRHITPETLAKLQRLPETAYEAGQPRDTAPTDEQVAEDPDHPDDAGGKVVVVPNSAGIAGGARAWELAG